MAKSKVFKVTYRLPNGIVTATLQAAQSPEDAASIVRVRTGYVVIAAIAAFDAKRAPRTP